MGIIYTISTLIFMGGCTDASTKDVDKLQSQLADKLGMWEDFDQIIKQEPDPQKKDIMLLKLAVQNPKYGPELCQRTTTETAKEKCRQVVGRPHLRKAK